MRPRAFSLLLPKLAHERRKRFDAISICGFYLLRKRIFPNAKAHATSNQNINSGAITKIALDTTDKDATADEAGGIADAAMVDLANDRHVIRRAGYYTVKGAVSWNDNNGTGQRQCYISKNGATTIARSPLLPASTVTNTVTECSVDVDLDEDDYVELFGLQNSGSNSTGSEAVEGYPWLSVLWKGL